ncbi:hypothetical protein Poli38472_009712 [Pythium oligandrum]|uniref:Uncharacterized protein n=1 Tax=Pythium oligandrum TaxID=41045 RepID=A0A8K1FIL9_PYTOL|nr:hypothetical protein Poli38472_009712 [Pythium oligandrum]|eukprot:TMW62219.1 hypothetical protein Poli38472_009712 [Pythium oligandrum]
MTWLEEIYIRRRLLSANGEDDDAAQDLQPKRTTSFGARFKNKKKPGAPASGNVLALRIALEREKTKYWARILLLFPLVPVCAALTTIVFGGVIINVATDKCNTKLMTFLQGAVVLSYVLVLFYAYCWMGPWSIKRLRTVRFFYIFYGLVCVVWWGIFGTLQAATATNSGFQSCLSMSPALYIMSQYEVAIFWILFLLWIGYVGMEMTAKKREEKQAARRDKRREELQAKIKAQAESQEQVLQAAQDEARRLEEEQKRKFAEEQDDLFRESDGEDQPNNQVDDDPDIFYADDHMPEDVEPHNEEDEDEEEVILPSSKQAM